MKALCLGVLMLIALVFGSLRANAQDAKSAEAFVSRLYQQYQTQKNFSPFFDLPTVKKIATPSLVALVQRDQKASAAAQEGSELDADPVSGSQDPDNMQFVGLKTRLTGLDQALVTVNLRYQEERVTRRLFLLAVKGEWRIDNITDGKGQDDLRAILNRSIAAHAPTPARKH